MVCTPPVRSPLPMRTLSAIPAILVLAVMLMVGAPDARASDELQVLGNYKDWTAYKTGSGANLVCYVVSDPQSKKLSRAGRSRGEVHFIVSHWPNTDPAVKGQPSVVIGYPFGANSDPRIQIGSDKFDMVLDPNAGDDEANRERAWLSDARTEERLLDAMRRGNTMVITARSSRGTQSTDSYSLLGFTAAMERIDKECR